MQTTPIIGNVDAAAHLTGKSVYLDDIPVMQNTLFVKVYDSKIAHGHIRKVDFSAALEVEGVIRIFNYKDITGENQIGGIIPDEPLLAEHEVHFQGQPILIIAAESEDAAHEAYHKIVVEIDPLPVITDPRKAFEQGQILSASRQLKLGNSAEAFAKAAYIFEGKTESGGQEHLYLETQGAYAYPTEHNSVKVHSSTQGPTAVQRTVSRVLGVGMNQVEIDVTRLGGGFGGKEDQASGWAAIVALVAFVLKRPAKYSLHRMEDMRMTGKRNPYSSDFKIGLDADYKIIAYEATYYQNGGAAADLSPAILERTLFHSTNSYFIPNVLVTAHSCKTNLPPNTAFRGFGGPQGMFVIEAAIDKAARALGVSPALIQSKNLLADAQEFPYGQRTEAAQAQAAWEKIAPKFAEKRAEADAFNTQNLYLKKGVAMMPICFGISFTNTMMNHARALVHIYSDGSVGVSTGAVEMGQGVNTKMIQVAAACFGVQTNRIKLESTNTSRVANTSPTAASATADLNGNALIDACKQLLERLETAARHQLQLPKPSNGETSFYIQNEQVYIDGQVRLLDWVGLINLAFVQRCNLSAKGHYATPEIHFDKQTGKGHPFAYHVYGVALTTCTVNCIKGTYTIDTVDVAHDFGNSFSPHIDLGQIEGGLVQGIGWMTLEEVIYNEQGRLLSNALSTYKIPDVYSVPKSIEISFLQNQGARLGILKSKAVGEPPLMYGIGAYFALRDAMQAFNPKTNIQYNAPMTPEKVLMGLYNK